MLSGGAVSLDKSENRMRELRFDYQMKLEFSSAVNRHYFALRCIPEDSPRQRIHLAVCQVSPADSLVRLRDGFGNLKLSGCCAPPHTAFCYHIGGTAWVEAADGEPQPLHPIYRYPSRLTAFEPEVVDFAEKVLLECRKRGAVSTMERAVCTMDYLHSHFEYIPGITNVHTTAAAALRLGRGVCQDYAHIMTAVLRYMGIPARYVNGLMIGEGCTHAWVEAYGDGSWHGLDPTNNLRIDDYYIKLAHGRDYGDCPVDKGIFFGDASQSQQVRVNVEEVSKQKG